MKYSFEIQKYDEDTEFLVVCIEDTSFNDFLNEFFISDGIPFGKELLAIIGEVRSETSEDGFFSGNAFEVELNKEFSKISTEYPISQVSECEIKTEDLFEIISKYLNEMKKYTGSALDQQEG